mmetsp:Transcript_87064/g.246986  ORF Transcript_87064/g.246986 Transcript_87064/m.246986 type:complete len:98 (+) Transcript_87064:169-462(+)
MSRIAETPGAIVDKSVTAARVANVRRLTTFTSLGGAGWCSERTTASGMCRRREALNACDEQKPDPRRHKLSSNTTSRTLTTFTIGVTGDTPRHEATY